MASNQLDHVTQDQAPKGGTVGSVTTTAAPSKSEWHRAARRASLQLAVLLGAALLALALLWAFRRDGKDVAVPAPGTGPAVVSEAQLEKLAKLVDHPIYWAGPKKGAYELTRTTDGRIYIRYLPSADKAGDRAPKYLTVGTYPTKTAFLALRRAAKREGAVSLAIDRGGLLVFNTQTPKSVYFGFPGAKYQVEVYDPSPQRARALVVGNDVKPIK